MSAKTVIRATVSLYSPETPPSPAEIDRLGFLRARIAVHEARIAPDVAEEKALTEKLKLLYTGAPGEGVYNADGAQFILELGQANNEQALLPGAKPKILKWLKTGVFLALADIPFGALKTVLSGQQYDQVVTKARTGSRSLKLIAKQQQSAAA